MLGSQVEFFLDFVFYVMFESLIFSNSVWKVNFSPAYLKKYLMYL